MIPCPICNRPALPRSQNPAAPFCSPRCKQVDLGQWLDERYRFPVAHDPEAAAEASGPASNEEGT